MKASAKVRWGLIGWVALAWVVPSALAQWESRIEAGLVWASRNEARIPGDTGTLFDLRELTGNGPDPYVRAETTFRLHPRHALRLTVAPLRAEGRGTLSRDVEFQGTRFAAGEPTRGTFRFNTFRLGYRWTFIDSPRWTWGGGFSALLRDAEIELTQAGRTAAKDDLGLVPLLNLRGEFRVVDGFSLVLDAEGAAAPQGRALDVALQARREFRKGWALAAGYRTLEGGANNDEVYTFSWFHFASLALERRF